MRKIYLLSLLLLSVLTACQTDNDEPAPGQRPDERLNKTLTDYKTALTGAPYGWKAVLTTGAGPQYRFLMQFTENDRVSMYADVSSEFAGPPFESTYRLTALQQPALLFDTYSPLHILADPDPSVLAKLTGQEGIVGQGRYSDFEFTIDSVAATSVRLTGNLQQSKLTLIQATQEEFNAYQAGQLKTVLDETKAYTQANPFIYLPAANGTRLQIGIDVANKVFSLVYLENGNVQIVSTRFTYTPRGLLFDPPLVLNGLTIQELIWDSAQQVFYADVNGSRVVVQTSPTVIVPLHHFVGVTFNAIAVPPQALPGWSPDFTSKHQQAAASMLSGPYTLRLGYTVFLFDTQSQTMRVVVFIYQGDNEFLAFYPYRYTKSADGVFKFTAQTPDPNGQAIAQDMSPILNHITNDSFTMDYFRDPTGTLGQLKSVQNPDFYFTGSFEVIQ